MSKAKAKSNWKLCEFTKHISDPLFTPSSLKGMFVGGLYLEHVHKQQSIAVMSELNSNACAVRCGTKTYPFVKLRLHETYLGVKSSRSTPLIMFSLQLNLWRMGPL